ncbi:MAG: TonB-dependent receptor [Gammaproteobacteria bacterium]|nr:TonB-dependent receptor [Gammaproteobacteria bacterium]MDE0510454.1 TonB-dependent receptor [Gammaproteobacteria bacterium]
MKLPNPALFASLLIFCSISGVTAAQEAVEEILVIGVTPSRDGAGLSEDKIPYRVQSSSAEDIDRSQSLDISDFLRHNLASITHNDAQNNPLQPDIQYRGYAASPLLGLAQGMSVYQNGVRINGPLGDTVNWDLLPESAIHSIDLIGGANPLFGLNTVGGALSVKMKDGFNSEGHSAEIYGGSWDRIVTSAESGGNNGSIGYYANVTYFEEDGWRDESPSDALNLYGSLSYRTDRTNINLNAQHGDSDLIGNGAIPEELLADDRKAIFTAPDVTENDLIMVSLDGSHNFNDKVKLNVNFFYRENDGSSFNGDGSEFGLEFDDDGMWMLVEEDDDDDDDDDDDNGHDDDDDDDNGHDDDDDDNGDHDDDDDDNGHDDNDDDDNGHDHDDDDNGDHDDDDDDNGHDDDDDEEEGVETYGPGGLSDFDEDDVIAVNNTSSRRQESYGTDIQLTFLNDLMGMENQLIMGFTYYKGESTFVSETEIAGLDHETRSTVGLGTGVFVTDAATNLETETETTSFYFMNALSLTEQLTLVLSGRLNNTLLDLQDLSGERAELNGEHDFFRFNPAVGLTFKPVENLNVYGSYSESNRAPTPVELACNDSVYDRRADLYYGGDEDDVEFECRLPNAFLADPPLNDVVSKSFEAGIRGDIGLVDYHLGFFHTTNHDDILFQTTGRATGLFANVDKTRHLGFEGQLNGSTDNLNWFLAYSYLEATFEDEFVAVENENWPSGLGDQVVENGDRIPGLPEHTLKLGADYLLFERLNVGFDVAYTSKKELRGNEGNYRGEAGEESESWLDPVGGYAVVNLRASYQVTDNIQVFGRVTNLFDEDYESFGLLGEEPDEVAVEEFEDYESPRFVGPGAPRAGFVGIKVSM